MVFILLLIMAIMPYTLIIFIAGMVYGYYRKEKLDEKLERKTI